MRAKVRLWWHDYRDILRAVDLPLRQLSPLGLIGFALVTGFMLWAGTTGTDRYWLDRIISDRTPGMISVAKWFTKWGELHYLPLFLALLLWGAGIYKRRLSWRLAGAAGLLGACGAGLVGLILKIIFGRTRPHIQLPDKLHAFTLHWDFQSFPSGHASHCWGLVAGAALLAPRWAWPYGLFAAAVCWSRMYLYRHYVSDIVGGFFCGVFIGLIFALAARRVYEALTSP
ncbi:hypothetical protein IMCC26134_14595 [Verrucomicrobia bacterium IMCC26134]|jgi:undecaprenyl-diphosphatase|nr:hypothetical protein IMCC26134_14595 [Verrucomicrobia bacterium IMCC26134]